MNAYNRQNCHTTTCGKNGHRGIGVHVCSGVNCGRGGYHDTAGLFSGASSFFGRRGWSAIDGRHVVFWTQVYTDEVGRVRGVGVTQPF